MGRTPKEKQEDHQIAERMKKLLGLGREVFDQIPPYEKKELGTIVARSIRRVLSGYHHLVKNKSYAAECEWRIIEVTPKEEDIKFETVGNLVKRYVEGRNFKKELLSSGSIITIGPRVPNPGAARAYILHLAKEIHKMKYTDVQISTKKYRPG